MGDVLFSTQPSSSYDFAVVRLRDSAPAVVVVVPVVAESFQPGGGQRSNDAAVLPTDNTNVRLLFCTILHIVSSCIASLG